MTSRSSIITEAEAPAHADLLDLIPPGEILLEEFMKPLGVSQNRLARDIDAPVSRIAGIVKRRAGDHRRYRPATGALLCDHPEIWLGLQSDHDLRVGAPQRRRPDREARAAAGGIAQFPFARPTSPRATIIRITSLVPSRIWWTRRSRTIFSMP